MLDGALRVIEAGNVFSTNHTDLARDACEKGVGCGHFIGYQVSEAIASGRLVELLKPYQLPPIPVNIVYPHARLLPSRARAFIERAAPRLRERLRDSA
jgi:DNA-binding transcriptional LysR family regulator